MMKRSRTGWIRIWDATGYSLNGIKAAWRNEAAFRQEVVLVSVLLPCAWWVGTTLTQRALLVFSLFVVLMVELLNSALETLADRIGTAHHELSGRAKDLGSAAVMVSLVAAAAVWGIVAWDKLH
jgi:diacylglycerol kinase (ATP)